MEYRSLAPSSEQDKSVVVIRRFFVTRKRQTADFEWRTVRIPPLKQSRSYRRKTPVITPIILPDVCLPPEEKRSIGIYGQRRRAYLTKHHRVLYYNLLTTGTLDGHLADIEEQARELFLRLVEQYADAEGVTERLKASEPQSWVRKMNGIRNRANEIVMQEIVYG